MTNDALGAPAVGDHVKVTDEVGRVHHGLVTAYWAGDQPNGAANVVYVSDDASKHDPYGNQIERLSSLSHRSKTTAPGRFWEQA